MRPLELPPGPLVAYPTTRQRSRKRCTYPPSSGLHGKRRRCLSPSSASSVSCAPAPATADDKTPQREPSDTHAVSPATSATSDDVIYLGSSSQLLDCVITSEDTPVAPPSATEVHPSPVTYQLPSNLTAYRYNDTLTPQILLLGDSTIRQEKLPACITYCVNYGKVSDITSLLPKILEIHPSVTMIIIHAGANNVMERQSARLHREFEELCFKIESLGKRCIISGPIPSPVHGSECFSRLFSLHQWLNNFSTASGFNFVGHFDYFWARLDLYDKDGIHPNQDGIRQLTFNLLNYIAFAPL